MNVETRIKNLKNNLKNILNYDRLYSIRKHWFCTIRLGTDDFFNCEKIETLVLKELIQENDLFKIPDDFKQYCNITMKSFPHDFGTYKELCLIYSQEFYDELDPSEENEFWTWVNEMECFDYESEEMIEKCRTKYFEQFPMKVSYRSKKEEKQNLKIS